MGGKRRSKKVEQAPVVANEEPLETWGVIDKSLPRVAWPRFKVIEAGLTLIDADRLAKSCGAYKVLCLKVRHTSDY